ncbi:MAG: hypothetical protein R2733_21505 [Acidimicrobiales bacterium]
MTVPVQRLALHTSDGLSLRAELASPEHPTAAALLCHPHPLHGGNMFATVIDALFADLSAHGVACLRFNFRGVDGSDGRHDYGRGEQLDVVAAIAHLAEAFPELDIWSMGWSFGADMSLGVAHPRLSGWFAVAPPLKIIAASDMIAGRDERPTLLAVPEHDQFNPPEAATAATEGWTNASIETIPMADHFLAGGMGAVTKAARRLVTGSD